MLRKSKKQAPIQRNPHLSQQKQNTFRYSSNRSQADKPRARVDSVSDSSRLQEAKDFAKRFAQLRYAFGSILAIGIMFVLSLLTSSPHIVVAGNASDVQVNTQMYQDKANDLSSGLLQKSKFFIDRQKIEEGMLTSFPEADSVYVGTPIFGGAATVRMTIADPKLLLNNGADTYVLDSRGVAVATTSKGQTQFKTEGLTNVSDQSNTSIVLGKPALTAAQTNFITELAHQSSSKQMSLESLSLTAGGGELIARYADTPYFVKYNLNEDARKSFGTYVATKDYLAGTKTTPAEYVDVRIPERAYVK